MKKLIALSLCALTIFSLAACGSGAKATKAPEQSAAPATQAAETVQIPNPFVDCKTMDEAARIAGFELVYPEKLGGCSAYLIQAIEGELVQVLYGDDDNKQLVRKGLGSEDISGVFGEFAEVKELTVGSLKVTTKGENGGISVAIWTNDGYSYAINTTGLTLTADEVTALVGQIDPTGDENLTQIANPFVDCKTMDEAARIAGFELTYPQKAAGRSAYLIQAIKGELIQVFYGDAEQEILVRKGLGSEDISGVFGEFAEEKELTVGSLKVTTKGENGGISVAIWTNDGYTFAIDATGLTLTADEVTALAGAIH